MRRRGVKEKEDVALLPGLVSQWEQLGGCWCQLPRGGPGRGRRLDGSEEARASDKFELLAR